MWWSKIRWRTEMSRRNAPRPNLECDNIYGGLHSLILAGMAWRTIFRRRRAPTPASGLARLMAHAELAECEVHQTSGPFSKKRNTPDERAVPRGQVETDYTMLGKAWVERAVRCIVGLPAPKRCVLDSRLPRAAKTDLGFVNPRVIS